MAPLQGDGQHSLRSGGLRCAPTTGYYLTAFQAEDDHYVFTQSLPRGGTDFIPNSVSTQMSVERAY